MEESLKNKTLSSLVWQFCQKIFGQLFSFIVTVILARLLMPEDYGVVALASMFNVLVGIFISGSMDAALIQKRDADELDYNTVFFSSLFMSFVIYGVVYFGAPIFASIYDNELITPVMRVLALTMPIGSLSMVQNAILSRQLDFKKFFKVSLIGQVIGAIVGILMAYANFGPWALVAQTMISSITNSITMLFLVSWHPSFMFSFARFRQLFDYAWKKTMASFIGTICNQLKGYIIGGKYSTADLAYYNRGEGLPEMLSNNISGSIDAVLFPALSKINDDLDSVKRGMRRSITTSSFVLMPMFFGLAATSAKLVPILYTEKWNPAVPFMQIACLSAPLHLLNKANLQSLFAIGRSDEVLKLEMYKKPVMLVILAITTFISPLAISFGMFLNCFYVLYMNAKPNAKLLNYPVMEQIKDVKFSLLSSILMFISVYAIGLVFDNNYISLCVQVISGICIYLILSLAFKNEALFYVKDTLLEIYRKRFGT